MRSVDINLSTQRLDKGFFGGILRIDVDMDPSRSHPIRRQPQSLDEPPVGWPASYSQEYFIPNDNPWQSGDSTTLEEFYALGLRAPYSLFYDELEDQLWVGDVGSDKFEEINRILPGRNYQWPYQEGLLPSEDYDRPSAPIGTEQPPFFFYPRDIGTSLVGGAIYRGVRFPSLDEMIVFADFTANSVMSIAQVDEPELNILISNIGGLGIDLPAVNGIVAVNVVGDGEILLSILDLTDFTAPGKILRLISQDDVPDPPDRLSALGVFSDMRTQTVADGFIPYGVNAPLWSDGSIKKRWISIPNDGTFDSPDEHIIFDPDGPWTFPEGTVFMKHFDLQTNMDDPLSLRPVETRFMVMTEDGSSYGLTYKWTEDGTEAFLQQSRSEANFTIQDGADSYDLQWSYPSRSQCITCHYPNAGYILGMNTHQMNGDMRYPDEADPKNQLAKYNELDIFHQSINPPSSYRMSYGLHDMNGTLDQRIRSYVDANCGFCHSPGGSVRETEIDLTYYNESLGSHLTYRDVESRASTNSFVVEPGEPAQSELYVRDASRGENQMPPIASNLIHQAYIDSLAVWIGQLDFTIENQEIILAQNPVDTRIELALGEAWQNSGYDIYVYDAQGKLMLRTSGQAQFVNIDASSLSAGIHILSVKAPDLKYVRRILIL